jgi:hypothetical protein
MLTAVAGRDHLAVSYECSARPTCDEIQPETASDAPKLEKIGVDLEPYPAPMPIFADEG